MFTMGINANSTLSNITKGAANPGSLQHTINQRSVVDLSNQYHRDCLQRLSSIGTHESSQRAEDLQTLLTKIQETHSKPLDTKNTLLLQLVSEYTHKAGGSVCVMCKSGKDRTGMAVTLTEGVEFVDAYQKHLANTGVHVEAF